MKKCQWSASPVNENDVREVVINDKKFICHKDNQKKLEDFLNLQFKRKTIFLSIIFLGIVPMLINEVFIPIVLIIQAINLWLHPFSTPQTINTLGVARSIYLVRVLSLLLVGIAIFLYVKG